MGSVRGVSVTCAVLLVCAAMQVMGGTGAHAVPPDDRPRLMAVGDSVTQGRIGDRTWRAYAWRAWKRRGVDVNMVGPYRKPKRLPGQRGAARYASQRFDRDHAGVWGARLTHGAAHDRSRLVRRFRPDVVVLQMGHNDLYWAKAQPAEVIDAVREWVSGSREDRPGVDFVLVEQMAPRTARAMRYNAALRRLGAELDRPGERVAVARAATRFVPRLHTYDGSHPNTWGDLLIARAVVDAMERIGWSRAEEK